MLGSKGMKLYLCNAIFYVQAKGYNNEKTINLTGAIAMNGTDS